MSTELPRAESTYQGNEEYWAQYVKGRPKIPQSYFDMIFDYHAKNGGQFGVAHDVGAGGGVHSRRLLDKFQHVIVSDPFENNIQAARIQLKDCDDRCTFDTSKLEDTIKTRPAQSVDLVFGQSMWHFAKPEPAMEAVAHQLKPGGTVVMSMAGFPVFKDPKVWELWVRMFHVVVLEAINKSGGPYGPSRDVIRSQLSQLESMPVTEELFETGAMRIRMKDPLGPGKNYIRTALLPDEFKDDFPIWSFVSENDIVKQMEETKEWTFQTDFEGMTDILSTYPYNPQSERQTKMWQEMKELMGDKKTEAVWPYTLVMATRRKKE